MGTNKRFIRICSVCSTAIKPHHLLWKAVVRNSKGELVHIKAFHDYLKKKEEKDV